MYIIQGISGITQIVKKLISSLYFASNSVNTYYLLKLGEGTVDRDIAIVGTTKSETCVVVANKNKYLQKLQFVSKPYTINNINNILL